MTTAQQPPISPVTPDTEWITNVDVLASLRPGTRVTDFRGGSYWLRQSMWHREGPAGMPVQAFNSWSLLFNFGRVRVTATPPTPADVVRQVMCDAHNIPEDLFADEIVARLTAHHYIKEPS